MQATDRNALVFNDMELVQQNRDKCNELPIEELHLPGEANKMHTPEDETCCFVRLATSVINDMIATSAQQPDEVLRWIFGFKATPALTSYSTFLAQNDNGTGLRIVAMCNITDIISLESNDTLQNSASKLHCASNGTKTILHPVEKANETRWQERSMLSMDNIWFGEVA